MSLFACLVKPEGRQEQEINNMLSIKEATYPSFATKMSGARMEYLEKNLQHSICL